MAREEHDREDLLAEATALVQRAEIELQPGGEHVVIGFRRDGCASVYFGASGDPAFHFNTRNELRRAFVNGQLWKADCGKLVAMRRQRSADTVQLASREIGEEETADWLSAMCRRLQRLAAALEAGQYDLMGQVPADLDVLASARRWLAELHNSPKLAASPHVK